MVPELEQHREAIIALCRQYQVQRLEVFGSAATGDFDPETSDFDFLVEFAAMAPGAQARAYLGLLAALEDLTGRRIDLVEVQARSLKNPYFAASVEESRLVLYAA